MRCNWLFSTAVVFVLALPGLSLAVDLYSQDFETNDTANWTVNTDTTVTTDPLDNTADFFFDYSTAGIPLAPHSTGPGTRGLNLQANVNHSALPGFQGISVSPTGKSFTGDFKLTCDYWGNFPGPFPAGSSGTTMLSEFGIKTSGTTVIEAGKGDGLWFAASLDGNSSFDYRAYSKERLIGYQLPINLASGSTTDVDDSANPIDLHATYLAGTRNNFAPADFNTNVIVDAADYTRWRDNLGLTGSVAAPPAQANGNANFDTVVDTLDYDLWKQTFGTPGLYRANFGDQAAPAAQLLLYPQQTGTTVGGSLGMEWHFIEIDKVGNLVTWKVDDVPLATVDLTNYTNSLGALGGDNILFGHADVNATASTDPLRTSLLFTLIDNVKVTTIPPGSGGGGSVPEPSTLVMVLCGLATLGFRRRLRAAA